MTVLRYILRNPVKAGIASSPGDYRWSSYLAYKEGRGTLTDMQFAVDLFGDRETLIEYLAQENDDSVMDETDHDWRLRDDAAKEKIFRITRCASASDYQKLDPEAQKEYAGKLYSEGLSMGQIARLTGMSKTTVFRAVIKSDDESGAEPDQQIEEQTKEIEKYSSLKVKVYLDYQEGLITKDEFIDINDSFTLKLDRLKASLEQYQIKKKEKLSLNIDDIPWIEEFLEYRNIQKLERRITISLIEKISIHDGSHIEITFRHHEEIEEIVKIALSGQEVTA